MPCPASGRWCKAAAEGSGAGKSDYHHGQYAHGIPNDRLRRVDKGVRLLSSFVRPGSLFVAWSEQQAHDSVVLSALLRGADCVAELNLFFFKPRLTIIDFPTLPTGLLATERVTQRSESSTDNSWGFNVKTADSQQMSNELSVRDHRIACHPTAICVVLKKLVWWLERSANTLALARRNMMLGVNACHRV